MPVDLLIQNGRVIDPSQRVDRVMNIAITGGRITALDAPGDIEAGQTLDAAGMIVCPGLIDLHAHVAHELVSLAVPPDEAGVFAGVSAVNDAGSVGYLHLNAFRSLVLPPALSDVFAFVNISPFGEAVLPETGFDVFDQTAMLQAIEANRSVVRGIKVRAIGELIHTYKVDVFELAWRIAREAGLPLMVHLGMGFNEPISRETIDRFIIRLLGRLEKGDILTHCYTDKPGGVFHMDGTPLSGLEQALSRGVYLDAAPGRGHIHFSLVKAALARGFAPHAFGTDVVRLPEEQPHFYNVTCVASKFIALDLPLSDALAAVSCNPARMLGEQDARGSLQPGMAANISILREHRGEFLFHDGRAGNVIPGSSFLSPQIVIKRGEIVHTRQSYRSHLPTQAWLKAALA